MANTRPVLRSAAFAIALALLIPSCGKQIGDSCTTNVDCAQDGTRDCDLSAPGGYCTVNGCDELSCPSEAVCIRVFPFENPTSAPACTSDSECTSDSLCLPDGFCVARTSERRFCERSCGSNGDCRGGYICRQAGIEGQTPPLNTPTYGTIALVANANQSTVVKFCAPSQ
jgi:hypothetical protein